VGAAVFSLPAAPIHLLCLFEKKMTIELLDRESLRKQITKLTDSELIRHGKAALQMCESSLGEASNESFVAHLEECREEWKRRRAARLVS
jgi:hypothetical protein